MAIERITFDSHGTEVVGALYIPDDAEVPVAGVVLIGPMTYCKEQVPTTYATRLVEKGYAALVFDPRYRGESGGTPRYWENPKAKVEDVISAVDYLAARPEVDASRIAGLSICQGGSELLPAVADDPRIRVFASIAGHYRDHAGDIEWLTEEGFNKRKATAQAARDKYEKTGQSDEVPAVHETREDVGMPGKVVWEWYQPWADRGVWENRYAVMSDAELLDFETLSAARRLKTPWMMVHSDECMLPDAAKRHFEVAPGKDKELVWESDTPHLHFYDHPEVIDPTVDKIDGWFRRYLAT